MGSWDEKGEDTRDKIFLGSSEEECLYNLWNTRANNPEDVQRFRGWAIFEVSLPPDWPLLEDEYGFTYTSEAIPPRYLRLLRSDLTIRKVMKMDDEGAFNQLHQDVF